MCLFYSMLPVKNTFMYLAIMCQPVEDGSYKASITYLWHGNVNNIDNMVTVIVNAWQPAASDTVTVTKSPRPSHFGRKDNIYMITICLTHRHRLHGLLSPRMTLELMADIVCSECFRFRYVTNVNHCIVPNALIVQRSKSMRSCPDNGFKREAEAFTTTNCGATLCRKILRELQCQQSI